MRFDEGAQRIAADDRRDDEPCFHRGRGRMHRAKIAGGDAAALDRRLAGDRRELDHRRDARRLRAIVLEGGRSGLVIQSALPEAFERAMFGEQEFECVDDARFTEAVRREDREARLLAEVEGLGLKIGAEALERQRVKQRGITHRPAPPPVRRASRR